MEPAKPTSVAMRVCSGSRFGLNGHAAGWMLSSAAPSRKPATATFGVAAWICAATASRLFMAPIAPAEQPANSRRLPGGAVASGAPGASRLLMTAATMRAPRNE